MPPTPTVSRCAFSIRLRPPPEPGTTATTLGRPATGSRTSTGRPSERSQPATNAAIFVSPEPSATRSGFTDSIATRSETRRARSSETELATAADYRGENSRSNRRPDATSAACAAGRWRWPPAGSARPCRSSERRHRRCPDRGRGAAGPAPGRRTWPPSCTAPAVRAAAAGLLAPPSVTSPNGFEQLVVARPVGVVAAHVLSGDAAVRPDRKYRRPRYPAVAVAPHAPLLDHAT